MPIEKINIEKFLELANHYPVIDVRSPGEYTHAQIPGAFSLPLFTDEERKIVGTAYKQQTKEIAIKIGLDFFGVKMKKMVEVGVEIVSNRHQALGNAQLPGDNYLLIHCWRGGMRSAAVAWLMDLYGFKVYTLIGGYKAFRNWVLEQFYIKHNLKILGGYTGSGKTLILQELNGKGDSVIDLEKLANHKGSAFGAIGEAPQPTQEMFENLLAINLFEVGRKNYEVRKSEDLLTSYLLPHTSDVWIEDESQRIGKLIIPNPFWENMRTSPVYFLDIPFEERLKFLVDTYGTFEKEKLADSIERINKRLGGLETQNALTYLLEDNINECFSILLKYYDKFYLKGLHNRKNYESLLNIIPCMSVNTTVNVNKLTQQEV
jgi:tRNA 2-selenouridine synthase